MIIKEAQLLDKMLQQFQPMTMPFLTEEQRKAVVYLKERVAKKKAEYPNYFKPTNVKQ